MRMSIGRCGLLLACTLVMVQDLRAQQSGTLPISPQVVASVALAARDNGNVEGLLGLVHPDAMARFKERQLEHDLFEEGARATMTSDNPELPDSVRRRLEGLPKPTRTLLQAVFRVRDRAAFERLSPEEVLRRWFQTSLKHVTERRPDEPTIRRVIVGEAVENDTLVHIVFREITTPDTVSVGGPDRQPGRVMHLDPIVRVLTVRRTRDGWRVMLNGGLVYDDGGGWGIAYD